MIVVSIPLICEGENITKNQILRSWRVEIDLVSTVQTFPGKKKWKINTWQSQKSQSNEI